MKWRGRRQSSNVEDQRNNRTSPRRSRRLRLPGGKGRRGGKLSIGMLVIVGGVLWAMGGDPAQILGMLLGSGTDGSSMTRTQHTTNSSSARNDKMKQFVATVLADTEDTWHRVSSENGFTYREPRLVLFSGNVNSACGFASAASGPFYCPGDSKVYIDLSFFDELKRKFEAPGDFAQAYVLAHEVGHHVQNLIGVLPEFNRVRRSLSKAEENAMSIKVELQADCFAGIWGHHTKQQGWLETGDLEEALNAATQIGDDAIQKRLQGYIVPESFNHGTSVQRKHWFALGFTTGKMTNCNTFGVSG
ncbi:MAG: zinc metallopeptidase [Cohaesibacteraceae bacterium]|nr:zinc metallopeptidase [Cohaesibacteraceae bacterium]MBL4876620.1 zinc metallopeptidase [Cohaesibacteraceae bacterium]